MEHRVREYRKSILQSEIGSRYGFLTVVGIKYSEANKCYGLSIQCDCGREGFETLPKLRKNKRLTCGVADCPHKLSVRQVNGKKAGWTGCGSIYGCKWAQWRIGAEKRGIPFEVTIEYAWELYQKQNGKCALTGLPLEFGTSWNRKCTASLDRIDSSKGYAPGNIQWVHKRVNLMKSDLEESEFIRLCGLVYAGATANTR